MVKFQNLLTPRNRLLRCIAAASAPVPDYLCTRVSAEDLVVHRSPAAERTSLQIQDDLGLGSSPF